MQVKQLHMHYNKYVFIICCFFLFQTCLEETTVTFSEANITTKNNTLVEVNIPKASGDKSLTDRINSEIAATIMSELHLGDPDHVTSKSIKESIETFNKEYQSFISDFPETEQIWEAQIDGEVIFQSEDIITISLTSYVSTGGAHGVLHIALLNFNPQTGKRISNTDLVNDLEGFKTVAKPFFDDAIDDKNILFEPDNFTLPANMGYSEEGLFMLYNVYEIAPYSSGVIDFTIPFENVNDFLVFDCSM